MGCCNEYNDLGCLNHCADIDISEVAVQTGTHTFEISMLNGINTEATVELARELTIPIIASGGVTDLKDVSTLCEVEAEGIMGVITGRAIYEGTLDFKKAQILADELGIKA